MTDDTNQVTTRPPHPLQLKQLFHMIVRVDKAQSSFLYFQFEAREGLCFYSTLPESLGQNYRDIDISCTLNFESILVDLLALLNKSFCIQILQQNYIRDGHIRHPALEAFHQS